MSTIQLVIWEYQNSITKSTFHRLPSISLEREAETVFHVGIFRLSDRWETKHIHVSTVRLSGLGFPLLIVESKHIIT